MATAWAGSGGCLLNSILMRGAEHCGTSKALFSGTGLLRGLFNRLRACQGLGTAICGVLNTQRSRQVDRNRSMGGKTIFLEKVVKTVDQRDLLRLRGFFFALLGASFRLFDPFSVPFGFFGLLVLLFYILYFKLVAVVEGAGFWGQAAFVQEIQALTARKSLCAGPGGRQRAMGIKTGNAPRLWISRWL